MAWDAKADGAPWEDFVEAEAQCRFQIARFFGLDMVPAFMNLRRRPDRPRPVKRGRGSWRLDGVDYVFDEKTKLVRRAGFSSVDSDSARKAATEAEVRKEIESWDGSTEPISDECFAVFRRTRELAAAEGLDWVYLCEMGSGTGVAFYPPFQLMWFISEPDLLHRWIRMKNVQAHRKTERFVNEGCEVVALGGDCSCDKGPFCSPAHYHEFILPAIQEHVRVCHRLGAKAVYTSDGNHWPIKEDFFFNSGIDGYKEVDWAAGMTYESLIEEGVAARVCIIGCVDQRHILCHGTPDEVVLHVRSVLKSGQKTPGGHILHSSHSIHEDVKVENVYAMFNAYREYFGMSRLSRP